MNDATISAMAVRGATHPCSPWVDIDRIDLAKVGLITTSLRSV
jgi:hypothetical protein